MEWNWICWLIIFATSELPLASQPDGGLPAKPAANRGDGSGPTTGGAAERSITVLRRGAHDLLKQEAVIPDGSDGHVRIIGQLLALHGEIVRHSTFADGQALRETRGRIQSRLVRIEREIRRSLRKAVDTRPLGQILPPPAAGQVPNGWGGAAGNAATAALLPDYGAELADLIRQAISPESWDVNGGRGAVVYFQPRQVLVIRATDEVHEVLEQFLWDMRAANGP